MIFADLAGSPVAWIGSLSGFVRGILPGAVGRTLLNLTSLFTINAMSAGQFFSGRSREP